MAEADALPQTPTEKRLAKIWADILNLQQIDIQESFFDLGGCVLVFSFSVYRMHGKDFRINVLRYKDVCFSHSLLAARVLKRVTEEFGYTLGVRDLFDNPTVSSFAKVIEGESAGRQSSPLERVDLMAEVDSYEVKDAVFVLLSIFHYFNH